MFSTFSGVGGMDIGGHDNGFETVYACDFHKAPKQFFANNFPSVPFDLIDVREITLEGVNKLREAYGHRPISVGEIDVLIAGSPCVKLAACNTVDARDFAPENMLMVENLVWLVRDLQPKIAWFENSDRLLAPKNDLLRFEFDSSMKHLLPNYTMKRKVIHAKRYGGFQTRSRSMTVLVRNDVLDGREICFFPSPEKVNLFKQGANVILPEIRAFWPGQFEEKYLNATGRLFCTLTASGCEMVEDWAGCRYALTNEQRMRLTGMSEFSFEGICKTNVKMLLGNMVLRQISERFFKHFKTVILETI